jgi:hypothetical protein
VRRLIFFVLGFVLAMAMILNMGCATVQKQGSSLFMDFLYEELEREPKQEKPEKRTGWIVQDDNGYRWEYHAQRRTDTIEVVARCEYTYIKYNGDEKWRGTYYGTPTDFYESDPPVRETDGLSGCVSWVNHHLYGDYYI